MGNAECEKCALPNAKKKKTTQIATTTSMNLLVNNIKSNHAKQVHKLAVQLDCLMEELHFLEEMVENVGNEMLIYEKESGTAPHLKMLGKLFSKKDDTKRLTTEELLEGLAAHREYLIAQRDELQKVVTQLQRKVEGTDDDTPGSPPFSDFASFFSTALSQGADTENPLEQGSHFGVFHGTIIPPDQIKPGMHLYKQRTGYSHHGVCIRGPKGPYIIHFNGDLQTGGAFIKSKLLRVIPKTASGSNVIHEPTKSPSSEELAALESTDSNSANSPIQNSATPQSTNSSPAWNFAKVPQAALESSPSENLATPQSSNPLPPASLSPTLPSASISPTLSPSPLPPTFPPTALPPASPEIYQQSTIVSSEFVTTRDITSPQLTNSAPPTGTFPGQPTNFYGSAQNYPPMPTYLPPNFSEQPLPTYLPPPGYPTDSPQNYPPSATNSYPTYASYPPINPQNVQTYPQNSNSWYSPSNSQYPPPLQGPNPTPPSPTPSWYPPSNPQYVSPQQGPYPYSSPSLQQGPNPYASPQQGPNPNSSYPSYPPNAQPLTPQVPNPYPPQSPLIGPNPNFPPQQGPNPNSSYSSYPPSDSLLLSPPQSQNPNAPQVSAPVSAKVMPGSPVEHRKLVVGGARASSASSSSLTTSSISSDSQNVQIQITQTTKQVAELHLEVKEQTRTQNLATQPNGGPSTNTESGNNQTTNDHNGANETHAETIVVKKETSTIQTLLVTANEYNNLFQNVFDSGKSVGYVMKSTIEAFAAEGPVYLANYKYAASEEIIQFRARRVLLQGGYNLFVRNCEHLATWCVTGVGKSLQIQKVIANKMSTVAKCMEKALAKYPDVPRDKFESILHKVPTPILRSILNFTSSEADKYSKTVKFV